MKRKNSRSETADKCKRVPVTIAFIDQLLNAEIFRQPSALHLAGGISGECVGLQIVNCHCFLSSVEAARRDRAKVLVDVLDWLANDPAM